MKPTPILVLLSASILFSLPVEKNLPDKIRSLGYNVLSDTAMSPTGWEKERYKLTKIRVIFMKSRREVPGSPRYYYRFTLEVDDCATAADAALRLKEVKTPPPGTSDPFAKEYLYPMRNGFQLGSSVYIIDTDAAMFFEKSIWMLDQLHRFLTANEEVQSGKL